MFDNHQWDDVMIPRFSVIASRQRPTTFAQDFDQLLSEFPDVIEGMNLLWALLLVTSASGVSATNLSITTGVKTLQADPDKAWVLGAYLYLTYASDASKMMVGQVTAYDAGTGELKVDVTRTSGSGMFSNWVIGLATPELAAVNISGGAPGTLLYQASANITAHLDAGAARRILQANGAAAPSWVSPESMVAGADAAGDDNFPRLSQVKNLIGVPATSAQRGTVLLASPSEAASGLDASKALTSNTLRAALNAAGSAPVFGCRAWVAFNGTTGVVGASGNVSSVTRNSAGNYTVNFTTPLQDANYSMAPSGQFDTTGIDGNVPLIGLRRAAGARTSSSAAIAVVSATAATANVDAEFVSVSFFR